MANNECALCKGERYDFETYDGNSGHIPVSMQLVIRNDTEPAAQLWIINEEKNKGIFIYINHCPGCGKLLTTMNLDLF